MAVQQFCLRWNNHQPNFISVFSNLLNSESLVDVTLAAEGKHLQAHKVVLSACSSYFQSLFTVNPCQHPIVILKDIKYTDLKIMVDFMYCGEVNVSQEQLPAVLKTAETLKVKGLAEMPEHNISLSVSNDKNNSDSPSPSPSMLRRKRLRKSSTGSGSGSTEQTTTGGSEETVGSAVASPSPITIKAEPFSEGEGSLRNEPSTDSEHGFPSQDSVEDDISQPHLSSQQNQQPSVQSNHTQPGQQQGSGQGQGQQSHHSQHQSSTSTEDRNDTGMGHSSSMEDNSPSTTSQPHYSPADAPGGGTMGSKRGRLLMRQHRIKKENDTIQGLEGEAEGIPLRDGSSVSIIPRVIERQCSEPTPQSPAHHSPNLLSVPQPSFLVKQHSSPLLLSTSLLTTPASPTLHVHLVTQSTSESTSTTTTTSTVPPATIRPRDELRRTASSPQVICSGNSELSESSRSCHCPVLRPGPALGCNFCWNTIDGHGRILRRKTKYHCPECQTNLCIVPCFQEYHERHSSISSGTREAIQPSNSSTIVPTIMKTSSM